MFSVGIFKTFTKLLVTAKFCIPLLFPLTLEDTSSYLSKKESVELVVSAVLRLQEEKTPVYC
jgi:hypothetical protein